MPLSAPQPKSQENRLPALDLLRFLAAFSVMLYHYTYTYAPDASPIVSALESVTRHGYLGVEMFFMISGFVILWSAQGRSAIDFVRARTLRLYPEFWVCVLVSAMVFRLVPDGAAGVRSAIDLLANLTMLPQYLGAPYVDGVYWTLGVEIKFYFLVWLLILANQLRFAERWLLAWVAGSAVASLIDVGGVARSVMIFPYGAFFAAGGLFFLIHDRGWNGLRAAGLAVALGVCAVQAVRGMDGFMASADITFVAQVTTVSVIAVAFGLFGMLVGRRVGAGIAAGAATAGALTYPLYLLHNVSRELFFNSRLGIPKPVAVPIAIVFSLVISYAVYRVSSRWVHPVLRRALDALGLKRATST